MSGNTGTTFITDEQKTWMRRSKKHPLFDHVFSDREVRSSL
jgi:hypothetical protein